MKHYSLHFQKEARSSGKSDETSLSSRFFPKQDSSPSISGELICCFEEPWLKVKSRPPQRVKKPMCRGQTLAVTESSYGFIKAQGISRVGIKTKGFSCCEKIIKITLYCEASCVVLQNKPNNSPIIQL